MAKTLMMYGLDHCSTCVKAREALSEAGWTVDFHDVKTQPLDHGEWENLLATFGEKLVNRASLTWRAMDEDARAEGDAEKLTARPSLIKRPAIIGPDGVTLGWTANVKRAYGVPA